MACHVIDSQIPACCSRARKQQCLKCNLQASAFIMSKCIEMLGFIGFNCWSRKKTAKTSTTSAAVVTSDLSLRSNSKSNSKSKSKCNSSSNNSSNNSNSSNGLLKLLLEGMAARKRRF